MCLHSILLCDTSKNTLKLVVAGLCHTLCSSVATLMDWQAQSSTCTWRQRSMLSGNPSEDAAVCLVVSVSGWTDTTPHCGWHQKRFRSRNRRQGFSGLGGWERSFLRKGPKDGKYRPLLGCAPHCPCWGGWSASAKTAAGRPPWSSWVSSRPLRLELLPAEERQSLISVRSSNLSKATVAGVLAVHVRPWVASAVAEGKKPREKTTTSPSTTWDRLRSCVAAAFFFRFFRPTRSYQPVFLTNSHASLAIDDIIQLKQPIYALRMKSCPCWTSMLIASGVSPTDCFSSTNKPNELCNYLFFPSSTPVTILNTIFGRKLGRKKTLNCFLYIFTDHFNLSENFCKKFYCR